ncbi:MAG: deoxyribose-phosphate aldolase [Planctomycetaceae bacterium]|nr:deoxyribose-phosphate aldolase [Planctomycetaceae bacterium]MBP63095.1 deoxyribose-phosphate aldolase [Planctomycetaceae bacterium]
MDFEFRDIATMIDHALLNPTLTMAELEAGCQLAVDHGVASVCIMPYYLKRCSDLLEGTPVKPSTTIGFPHGNSTIQTKQSAAVQALEDGCQELDMVVNISQVLSGNWAYVRQDIQTIVEVSHAAGRKVKVIFENCYLQDQHKRMLCQICNELRADWVKTSTGFGTGGAILEDLKLMVENTADHVQVKAAGGIGDLKTLLQTRALGVTRIGTSRTQELLRECRRHLESAAG